MGLNGVDNGTISFENVTIQKENMLDRFSSVNEKGTQYQVIISGFTMLGTLIGGRMGFLDRHWLQPNLG
jgi:acyl-CoA oxidase